MFTDSTATPNRVEMLLEVTRFMSDRRFDAQIARDMLQPKGLPGLTEASAQANDILGAARQLQLIETNSDGQIRAVESRRAGTPREVLLDALDRMVLLDSNIEPWFGLFYAYLLGRNLAAEDGPQHGKRFEEAFESDVFGGESQPNRFNEVKYRGLRRWFRYAGLGWHDGEGRFHPNPYSRLQRALPRIFEKAKLLDADAFMVRMGQQCPELDGGWMFERANRSNPRPERSCSLGLSHALIDLHLDGVLTLDCPLDSDGWSLAAAAPPRDGKVMRSDRFVSVAYPASKERARG